MSDDLIQQVTQNAPVAGAGGLLGGTGIIAALKLFKIFAAPQDLDLVEARVDSKIAAIRAEFAEKYVTQEMFNHFDEKLDKIQDRIDQLFDRK